MSEKTNISHRELCLAVAKRYNKKIALYEYKSSVSREEPDVLIFSFDFTVLFEIKITLSDFRADRKKDARKKCVLNWRMDYIAKHFSEKPEEYERRVQRQYFRLRKEQPEFFYIQDDHLGNHRYYVCPWGLIPVEEVPEGWGLLYYRNGKFYEKKRSEIFRSNLKKENNLVIHALRRYASGDNTGILINTYGGEK